MIIKLTNASKGFENKHLLVNTDFIVSIFEDTNDSNGGVFVFSSQGQTWQVKESIVEIYKMVL